MIQFLLSLKSCLLSENVKPGLHQGSPKTFLFLQEYLQAEWQKDQLQQVYFPLPAVYLSVYAVQQLNNVSNYSHLLFLTLYLNHRDDIGRLYLLA